MTAAPTPVQQANRHSDNKRPQTPSRLKHYLTAMLLILLVWGSAWKTESTLGELVQGAPNMLDLLKEMFPPSWTYMDNIAPAMLDTIRMAVVGTTIGAVLAIPFAVLCASNVVRNVWVFYPVRMVLNLIRTIPDLLLASLFVAVFGLGLVSGILALSVFSIGLVAKLTYEAIESIDNGPLEAMTAVGANRMQWIAFGVVPQVIANYISYVLYTFEVNVRAAAILGLVGAGGIGHYYEVTLGFLQYDRTNAIIIFTLVVVLLIDFISTKVRERLL